MDPRRGSIARYVGNYSAYAEQRASELARQHSRYQNEQALVRRVRQDIARTKEQARRVERATTPRQPNVRRLAKKVARKARTREAKLERFQAAPERAERPTESWRLKVEFGSATGSDRGAGTERGGPRDTAATHPSWRGSAWTSEAANGWRCSGPTAAARPPCCVPWPERWRRWAVPCGARRPPSSATWHRSRSCWTRRPRHWTRFGRREPPRRRKRARFLHLFLFTGDDALRPIGELSYGERTRLSLALLVARGATVLLLDEPLNHLDIDSRERFETALDQFAGAVVVVSHDRYFVGRYAATRWEIREQRPGRRRLAVERGAGD